MIWTWGIIAYAIIVAGIVNWSGTERWLTISRWVRRPLLVLALPALYNAYVFFGGIFRNPEALQIPDTWFQEWDRR